MQQSCGPPCSLYFWFCDFPTHCQGTRTRTYYRKTWAEPPAWSGLRSYPFQASLLTVQVLPRGGLQWWRQQETPFSLLFMKHRRRRKDCSLFFFSFFGRANEQSVLEDWSQLSALRRRRCFLVRFPSSTMNSEVGCVRRQPCPLYFLSFHSCSVGVAYGGCTEVWLGMSLLGLLSFLMWGAGVWCWCLGFHPKSKPCNSISVASNCRSCIESDFTRLSARNMGF